MLDSAGKRAAFALFYAPLHFLAADHVVRALGAHRPPLSSILDIGCGTGAGGAAWALAAGGPPVTGIDRHPWAVDEARWTYRQLGLRGHARIGDISKLPTLKPEQRNSLLEELKGLQNQLAAYDKEVALLNRTMDCRAG